MISSGPGALSGATFSMAHSSCCFVMMVSYGAGSGYVWVLLMSEVFARGNVAWDGSSVCLNCSAFSSLVVAVSFIVGMYCCVGLEFI